MSAEISDGTPSEGNELQLVPFLKICHSRPQQLQLSAILHAFNSSLLAESCSRPLERLQLIGSRGNRYPPDYNSLFLLAASCCLLCICNALLSYKCYMTALDTAHAAGNSIFND